MAAFSASTFLLHINSTSSFPAISTKFRPVLTFKPFTPDGGKGSWHSARCTVVSSAGALLSLEEAFQAPKSEDTTRYQTSVESFLEHVKLVNSGSEERSKFIPFIVDNIAVGYIHPSFLQHLVCFPDVFTTVGFDSEPALLCAPTSNSRKPLTTHIVTNGSKRSPQRTDAYVTLHQSLKTREDRTKAVNRKLKLLNEKGVIKGWRNELYPVVDAFGKRSLFSLERAAVPHFGVKAYAIHMNGYVKMENGERHLWVARRSVTKPTFPGMLDHLVAGGQPEGLSCKENVIKECDEEASIPRAIAERAKAVGAVSYDCIDGDRFDRFILFCYDLELPLDFQPENKDGEVDSFTLVPVAKVVTILLTTRLYKPDCALVIIDFLIRHGYLNSDQIGYLELLQSLRMGVCI